MMRSKPMSREHKAWLLTLIDQYGANRVIKRIRSARSRTGRPGRPAVPDDAKRLDRIQFFLDVAFAIGGPFDPKSSDDKLAKAIETVAEERKLGLKTARRYYTTARAEYLSRPKSVQAVFPNSAPLPKIAQRLGAWHLKPRRI